MRCKMGEFGDGEAVVLLLLDLEARSIALHHSTPTDEDAGRQSRFCANGEGWSSVVLGSVGVVLDLRKLYRCTLRLVLWWERCRQVAARADEHAHSSSAETRADPFLTPYTGFRCWRDYYCHHQHPFRSQGYVQLPLAIVIFPHLPAQRSAFSSASTLFLHSSSIRSHT